MLSLLTSDSVRPLTAWREKEREVERGRERGDDGMTNEVREKERWTEEMKRDPIPALKSALGTEVARR